MSSAELTQAQARTGSDDHGGGSGPVLRLASCFGEINDFPVISFRRVVVLDRCQPIYDPFNDIAQSLPSSVPPTVFHDQWKHLRGGDEYPQEGGV